MTSEKYTESQILCGLLAEWENLTGNDDPFDAETSIIAYMRSDGSDDELDLADIFRRLECFFEFECSDQEWLDFFRLDLAKLSVEEWERTFAPRITFGALARFIAERAPVIASFEPINILDQPCAPAGVFVGIQQLVKRKLGSQTEFAPSTPITDVMRGNELEDFWKQLSWMTEQRIPELSAFWSSVTGLTGCLGTLATFISIFMTFATGNPAWIIFVLIGSIVTHGLALEYKRLTNPLPSQVATFRDLSILIADNRSF